jgi:hypothetical protein
MPVSMDQAERIKPLAFDIVSKTARVSGVGVIRQGDSYAVKVNLHDGVVPGLPKEIDGVPIVYQHITSFHLLAS